jgi:hopanoid-associated phosphorylase
MGIMRVGVLTGLAAEARLLHGARLSGGVGLAVARTGADAATARREAERLVLSGVAALVSFGVAGGLDPRLRAGDLVLADRVILPGGRAIAAHAGWRREAQERLGGAGARAVVGAVAGSDRLLVTPAEKRLLCEQSGGLAGDMESGAVAEVAAEAGLPFLVLRAVSDGATRALPQVACVPLRPDGGLSLGGIAHALCTRPGEWPAVARLAVETRAAMAALRAAVRSGALVPPGVTLGDALPDDGAIALQAA